MKRSTVAIPIVGVTAAAGTYGSGTYGSGTYGQPAEESAIPDYRLRVVPVDAVAEQVVA